MTKISRHTQQLFETKITYGNKQKSLYSADDIVVIEAIISEFIEKDNGLLIGISKQVRPR